MACPDLVLKPSCGWCGATTDLYGSSCKHMTLCVFCGKTMAENRGRCYDCGAVVTTLIREYNVRASTAGDKTFYIGRFVTGLPPFSRKKSAENKWSLEKEGLQGRQLTDDLREKYKSKPWLLEDETGQHQYRGQLEGAQSATYYLLMMQGKEFVAVPAGSWYNFNKVAQYKQLTLEEAEQKMSKRKHTADGYGRWMMKAATNGPAAFGEAKKEVLSSSTPETSQTRKIKDDEDGGHSDRGEQDAEEEAVRKSRVELDRKARDKDDEGGGKGGDFELDDDDAEKGDDWEHEETFTDDDEAVGNDPEEREDLATEVPAPPEIKQDDEDEGEEEDGLSKSGKELKKLLGRTGGLNEPEAEKDEDEDDMEDEVGIPLMLVPKEKDLPKDEPTDSSPFKSVSSASTKGTPSASKSAKSKKEPDKDDDSKASSITEPAQSLAPVTEDEIRAVLLVMSPVTTQDLVAKFKPRLRSPEDRKAFAEILKRICRIQGRTGANYVVLRDK